MSLFFGILGFGRRLGDVTLSGETGITDLVTGAAQVSINADGTMSKIEGLVETQIDAATDWILPNDFADSGRYEAKWTYVSGDLPASGTMPLQNTWYPLGVVDRTIGLSGSPPYTASCTITLYIKAGGTVLSQADYSMSVNVGPP